MHMGYIVIWLDLWNVLFAVGINALADTAPNHDALRDFVYVTKIHYRFSHCFGRAQWANWSDVDVLSSILNSRRSESAFEPTLVGHERNKTMYLRAAVDEAAV